jgi:hypothetical protein
MMAIDRDIVSRLSGSCLALALVCATPAYAIECDGDFQNVHGQPVSTPYCRDGALAAVAREHGFQVSDKVVRDNPSRKEELCRYLNSDIRAKPACADVMPDGGRH